MDLDLPFLANEAVIIFEKNLDTVPLKLKTDLLIPEKIFDITIELKKDVIDPVNELILPACLQLVSYINNQYPVNGCEFTRLSLEEETKKGCINCYKGISIKLVQVWDTQKTRKGCEILSILIGVSKKINPIKESNTMLHPITINITEDEFILRKKNKELLIKNISEDGDGCRIKTFNKRELKEIAKFILDSILEE